MIHLIYLLSTLAGGFICAKAMNSRRIIWGLITAAGYFIILYLISLIVGGTQTKELLDIAKMAGCCLAGGIFGGILS
jgi:putative membrane protein (TIGR04086 family)